MLFGADFYSGDLEKTAANYLRAASFVRFFIDEYGLETMLHVYREVAHDADVSVIDGALRSITGFPLADVLKAWAARGPVGTAEYCLWPEARLFKSLPAGSDEAAVLDPTPRVAHGLDFTNETSFGLQRVLSVPKSGFHRVAVDATADLSISLLPSEGGMVGFLDMKTGNNVSTEAIVDLAAGAYWLDTVGWSAASAHLFWEPTPAGLSTTCGEGAAIPLPTGISTRLITWRPPAQACDGKTCRGWLALAAAVDTTVFLAPSPESPEPGADFNLVCESSCNVCVPAASRVAAKAGGTTYVQWELKLGPSSPIPHGTPVRPVAVGDQPRVVHDADAARPPSIDPFRISTSEPGRPSVNGGRKPALRLPTFSRIVGTSLGRLQMQTDGPCDWRRKNPSESRRVPWPMIDEHPRACLQERVWRGR